MVFCDCLFVDVGVGGCGVGCGVVCVVVVVVVLIVGVCSDVIVI